MRYIIKTADHDVIEVEDIGLAGSRTKVINIPGEEGRGRLLRLSIREAKELRRALEDTP